MEADLIYFRRRAAEEAAAAESAEHFAVRNTHFELARRYQDRIAALEGEHNHTAVHLVSAA